MYLNVQFLTIIGNIFYWLIRLEMLTLPEILRPRTDEHFKDQTNTYSNWRELFILH